MQATQLLLVEPIRVASILEPSSPTAFSALTKVISTLGPQSRNVETIKALLKAGMSVARIDFSWGDDAYYQETLDNLKKAVKNTHRLCAMMLDTVGPQLYVTNSKEETIELQEGATVVLTGDKATYAFGKVLPINYDGLASVVKQGNAIFLGQYLFIGNETTSVWLEVVETKGTEVVCSVKNTATLTGSLFVYEPGADCLLKMCVPVTCSVPVTNGKAGSSFGHCSYP